MVSCSETKICSAVQRAVRIEKVLRRENVRVIFGKVRHYLQMFSQNKNRQIINTGFLKTGARGGAVG